MLSLSAFLVYKETLLERVFDCVYIPCINNCLLFYNKLYQDSTLLRWVINLGICVGQKNRYLSCKTGNREDILNVFTFDSFKCTVG